MQVFGHLLRPFLLTDILQASEYERRLTESHLSKVLIQQPGIRRVERVWCNQYQQHP